MKKLIILGICVIAIVVAIIIVSANKNNDNENFGAELVRPSKDSTDSVGSFENAESIQATEGLTNEEGSKLEDGSEIETYKDAEILKVVSFTSVVCAGDEVTLTLSGMPNTRYDIYVYYSKNPATATDLEPKMSDGEGKITWNWRVPSSVKEGLREIDIVGGGEILKIYLDIV